MFWSVWTFIRLNPLSKDVFLKGGYPCSSFVMYQTAGYFCEICKTRDRVRNGLAIVGVLYIKSHACENEIVKASSGQCLR